jgi:hypothetical protein
MGTASKKTATNPLPAGAKLIVRNGQRLAGPIDRADVLAERPGVATHQAKVDISDGN